MVLETADGQKIEIPDEYSMLVCMMNGRFGGTGIYFAPVAMLNDGLMDLIFHHGPAKISNGFEFYRHGISGGGKHVYLDNYSYFRAKKLTFYNRNFLDLESGGKEERKVDVGEDQDNRPKK